MGREFSITWRTKFDFRIFDLSGDMDYKDALKLDKSIQTVNPEIPQVILNMENVEYITGTALNYLVKMKKEHREPIYIMNANHDLRRQFISNSVQSFFTFIESEYSLIEKQKKKELNEILDDPT